MSIEVSCGNCHGRLLIEQPGVVVACPHCGTHLTIEAPDDVAETSAEPASETVPESAGELSVAVGSVPVFEAPPTEAPVNDTPLPEV